MFTLMIHRANDPAGLLANQHHAAFLEATSKPGGTVIHHGHPKVQIGTSAADLMGTAPAPEGHPHADFTVHEDGFITNHRARRGTTAESLLKPEDEEVPINDLTGEPFDDIPKATGRIVDLIEALSNYDAVNDDAVPEAVRAALDEAGIDLTEDLDDLMLPGEQSKHTPTHLWDANTVTEIARIITPATEVWDPMAFQRAVDALAQDLAVADLAYDVFSLAKRVTEAQDVAKAKARAILDVIEGIRL